MKKFKINSDILINVLDPLQAVISATHIVPILQCVNIEISNNKINVTGDNHEVRCTNSEDLISTDTIDICISFQMILAALRTIKNQEITLKVDDHNMVIMHKQGDFKIPLEDVKSYPKAKEEKMKLKAEINAISLKKTLKIANKFVIDDNLEPMANLSIEIGKKTIIRSTNKISLFQETIKGGGDEARILISGKASSSIHNLMDDNEESILLKYNENMISFKFGKKLVTAVQQTGNFPIEVFNKVINSMDESVKVEVNKDKFVTSIRRVSTLSAKEKLNTVKLILTENNMNLSCDNEMSSSKVQEDLEIKTTKDFTIGFNSRLLIEVLSVFEKNAILSIGNNNMLYITENKRRGLIAPVLLNK